MSHPNAYGDRLGLTHGYPSVAELLLPEVHALSAIPKEVETPSILGPGRTPYSGKPIARRNGISIGETYHPELVDIRRMTIRIDVGKETAVPRPAKIEAWLGERQSAGFAGTK